MRHLNTYKIFESDDLKDPIDVESDVIDFREKFGSNRRIENVEHMLKKLVDENPTMSDNWDIYEIYNTNDIGLNTGKGLVLVKAINGGHARVKASNIINNIEIYATGFYTAVKIDKKVHELRIKSLEDQLQKLKNIQ
jgi:hypothetical protein